jgi:capsid protein
MVTFWALLDDWVFNTVVPQMCNRPFAVGCAWRRIRRREPKLLEVRAEWTPPKRSWVDPLKDITAEALEVRNFGGLPSALAARGRDYREAFNEIADVNKLIDSLGIALDSDPRRVNRAGALQPAAGYLRPTGDSTET